MKDGTWLGYLEIWKMFDNDFFCLQWDIKDVMSFDSEIFEFLWVDILPVLCTLCLP